MSSSQHSQWQSGSKGREAMETSSHTQVSVSVYVDRTARAEVNLAASTYG